MSKEDGSKISLIVVIIALVLMTVMSILVFIVSSGVQDDADRFTQFADKYNKLADLADEDVQEILQEDIIKHEAAFSLLHDVYALNDQYKKMKEYNVSHPGAYVQQDFDEISIEVIGKIRLMIDLVYNTELHWYCTEKLNATVENDYRYRKQYLFITNKWHENYSYYETFDVDLKLYVQNDFDATGDVYEIPEINIDVWTHYLYHNLSIVEVINPSADILSYLSWNNDISLNLANVSIIYLVSCADEYFQVSQDASYIIMDYNNTLITFATSAVVLGFAISFSKKYRVLLIVVGLVTLFLAFVYFISAFDQTLDYRTKQILEDSEFIDSD